MKYKIYSLFFLLAFTIQTSNIVADEFDDLDSLTDFASSLNENELKTLRSCEPGEAGIWTTLFEAIDLPAVFDEDFYKRTNIPNYRNVINFPNFFIFSYQPPKEQQITFNFFYNQSINKSFRENVKNNSKKHKYYANDCINGRRVGSYLNIENGTVPQAIQKAIDLGIIPPELSAIGKIQFPRVFETIGNARLEERHLGVVGHYFKEINPTLFFEAKMPFLWKITNLNFTDKEQEIIRQEFEVFQTSGSSGTNTFDEVAFGQQHLIFDALGTGTLDLTLKKVVYDNNDSSFELGGSLYLPTDGHWKRGLYGTYFDPKDQQPILPFCDIVNINAGELHPGGDQVASDFLLKALDHFSSIVLQCPLGYEQHLAFALKALPYYQFNENLEYSGVWIFEYIAPRNQTRFFVSNPSETLFSEQFAQITDPEEQLSFFEQKMSERLFPRALTAKVSPGFLLNTVANFQLSRSNWNFTAGYNWWYKSSEKISKIKAPSDIQVKNLNVCKAERGSASQVKLYGKAHTSLETYQKHTISLSLFADATIYSYNIGNDFTIGLSFDKTF